MTKRDNASSDPRQHHRPRGERGQSLIEFAVTGPVLLFLLIALIELGNGLNSYLTVLASARDAARLGAQIGIDSSDDVTALKTLIANETARLTSAPIADTCPASGEGICITTNAGCSVGSPCSPKPEDYWLQVKVCYDHPLMVGLPWTSDDDLLLCSKTKMRIAS
jgi:hypothetical protein